MTIKERVISEFLNSERNFDIYETSEDELSKMYDTMKETVEKKKKWTTFLLEQKAITKSSDGVIKVRFDREVMNKNGNGTQKLVFKYPVYNFLRTKFLEITEAIKIKTMPNE